LNREPKARHAPVESLELVALADKQELAPQTPVFDSSKFDVLQAREPESFVVLVIQLPKGATFKDESFESGAHLQEGFDVLVNMEVDE
jgi:hypothetical protein